MTDEKRQIIRQAVDMYDSNLTVEKVCRAANITSSVFESHFDDLDDLWTQSYAFLLESAVHTASEIPDLSDAELHDKLAALIFILLDVIEGCEVFAKATFKKSAAGLNSAFQTEMKNALSDLFESHDVPGINKVLFDNTAFLFVASESFVQLILTWLNDSSDHRERSTALIERSISWWAEIFTNRIPDRSIDLIRYGIESDYLPIKNLPFVRDWFRDDSEQSQPGSEDD